MTAGEWDEAIEAAARAIWSSLGSELGGWDDSTEDEHKDAREVASAAVFAAAPLIARVALEKAADELLTAKLYRITDVAAWLRERAKEAGGA